MDASIAPQEEMIAGGIQTTQADWSFHEARLRGGPCLPLLYHGLQV